MKKITFLITVFFLAFNLNAQIVYFNPDPDKVVTINHGELIDFYELTGLSSGSIWFSINPVEKSNSSKADGLKFGVDLYKCNFVRKPGVGDPDKLTFGHQINASSVWQWPSEWEYTNAILAVVQGEDVSGAWAESDGNFLGFRFLDNNGDTIYGWVRLTVNISEETIKIHDYAINLTPNEGIFAGEGMQFCASDITLFDANDYGDVRDFRIDFKISTEEDSVNYYKVFLVPSNIAEDFDLAQAENVLPENCLQISTNGSNYYSQMPLGLPDVNGNQISEHVPYNAFVLTNYRFQGTTLNCLADMSNEEILDENLKYFNPEPDLILDASDGESENMPFDFNQDGLEDLRFYFEDMVYAECDSRHYLYFSCLNSISISWFGNVLDEQTSFNTHGQMISEWKRSCDNIWYCDVPLEDGFIGFKYLAETDTSYGWIRIETDSVLRRLYIKDYAYYKGGLPIYVGQGIKLIPEKITMEDISDYQNSSDIFLSFDKFFRETEVEEYRLMFVPAESAESFTLADAESVSENRYLSILPSGTDYSDTLPANLVDIYGNSIAETILYKAFVLTLSTDGSSFTNCISSPVDISIFTNVEQVHDLTVSSTYNGGSDYTLNIDFDTPLDESGIEEYRAFIIPESQVVDFDTTLAATVIPDRYISFETNSPLNHSAVSLNRFDIKDINGNIPGYDNVYKIAVMSLTNWNNTNRNNIVISDQVVSFFTPCAQVKRVFVQDVGNTGTASDIEVNFIIPQNPYSIDKYRIFIVPDSVTFSLISAESIPENLYYETDFFGNAGDTIKIILPSDLRDANDNAIEENQTYSAYVISIADIISADFNALSIASPRFIIGNPDYFYTGKKTGENIVYYEYYNDNLPSNFYLDLNHDGIDDLRFLHYQSVSVSSGEMMAKVTTLNSSKVLALSNWPYAPPIEEHYYLNDQMPWKSGELVFTNAYYSPACAFYYIVNWANTGPGYLAVLIPVQNDTIQAWIKFKVDNLGGGVGNVNFTIFEYGLFGKYLNIEENKTSGLSIYPNPSNGEFKIEFEDYIDPSDFEITDITGRVVYRGNTISKYTEVNLSGTPKGMYFIRISNEESTVKKIVIQ